MRFVPAALLLDALCVLAFVVIGRINHEEGLTAAGVALTLWPFLAGTAAGWAASLPWKPWRNPAAVMPTGVLVLVLTVGAGMLLRSAAGGGTPLSFVVVAALFLSAALLGWRAIALLLRRRSGGRTAAGARSG
ncbi:DUF3054 domain-containing protein [Streptomonospora sp. PA3]|uniref:DUF3054 domain-containing protein n=1 Tax=Streptomonospora sp. PA3 TaxID=2607326 RepID=UPI0012DE2297|nr:DUF3054 domain-containing protein [Streptomonospora sp. PA3]MUL39807.1 DUF3054 domain-containing protein [Streptomonospora sp. PA3]